MTWLYTAADYAALAAELAVCFGIIGRMAEKKFSRKLHWLLFTVFAADLIFLAMAFDYLPIYAHFTTIVWLLLVSCGAACLYRFDVLSAFCVVSLYAVFVRAAELAVLILIEVLMSSSGYAMEILTDAWLYHGVYRLLVRIGLAAPCLLLLGKKHRFKATPKTAAMLLAIAGFCAFGMEKLLEVTNARDYLMLRRGILVTWLFFAAFACSAVVLLRFYFKMLSERSARSVIEVRLDTLARDHQSLAAAYRDIAKMTHDMKNHLRTIAALAQQEKYEELISYVGDVEANVETMQVVSYTGISSLDALIHSKVRMAKKEDIPLQVDASILHGHSIRSADICAITANLLDNAIDACRCLESGTEKWVTLSISYIHAMVMIKCVNPYRADALLVSDDGDCLSTKSDGRNHGYGLEIVKELAAKYDGALEIRQDGMLFTAVVMLSDHN